MTSEYLNKCNNPFKDREKNKDNSTFKNLYFVILYLYTSMPTQALNVGSTTNIVFLIIPYLFAVLAIIKYKIPLLNKRLLIVLGTAVVLSVIQKILRPYISISPFIFSEIILAYVAIKVYGKSIFRRFEDITYFFSIIALVGWFLSIVFYPYMLSIAKSLSVLDVEPSYTFYIYSITKIGDTIRNSGFAWEPGRMACIIDVALLFYLLRTRLKFNTFKFYVLVSCLITTFSTTGYIVFLIVIFLSYISIKKVKPSILIGCSVLGLILIQLPFVGEKIPRLMSQANEDGMTVITSQLSWANENKEDRNYYCPQRFEGLVFSSINLINSNFWVGEGRNFLDFYVNREKNWMVKTSEGLIEHSVRYGIIIGLISFLLLYKASRHISNFYHTKNSWAYFIIFFLINISYNFWEVPLFMAIWMMPIYLNHFKLSKYERTIYNYSNCVLQ